MEQSEVEMMEPDLGFKTADKSAQKKRPAVKRCCWGAFKITVVLFYLLLLFGLVIRYAVNISNHESKYNNLKKTCSELQANNTELQTNYRSLKNDSIQLQEEIKGLKNKTEELQRIKRALRKANTALQRKIMELGGERHLVLGRKANRDSFLSYGRSLPW
ncbi:uncharacterized protein KZ484_007006 [Pholidichthys leucotaenia]